jgi:hypothetical protein
MSYPEVKKYASVYSTQTFFTNQTIRVLNAYAGGAAIFPMFNVDNKAAAEVKERDIDSALQSVLAARAELTLYAASPPRWTTTIARRCNSSFDPSQTPVTGYSTRYLHAFLYTFAPFNPPIMSVFWFGIAFL